MAIDYEQRSVQEFSGTAQKRGPNKDSNTKISYLDTAGTKFVIEQSCGDMTTRVTNSEMSQTQNS